ncbi:PCRF domain-containing protein, partial [bacterium]|nr:PCRF domain-containing protein [bacterium]
MENNKETKKELAELEEQLQNPEIYNNGEKLKEISKKYNELKKFLNKLNQLEEINRKIFDTQKMLNQESAPEM